MLISGSSLVKDEKNICTKSKIKFTTQKVIKA